LIGRPFFYDRSKCYSNTMKQMLLVAAILISACNREEQPQAPTTEESDRLNDAEAMLNGLANEEGPATEAADPSNRSE
jgi:hypothetical protein